MSDDLTGVIAQLLREGNLVSEVKDVTIGQLTEYLKGHGFLLFVFVIGHGKSLPTIEDIEQAKRNFMIKFNLNEEDIKTIKLCGEGLTDEDIAEKIGITAEGIRKRIKKIRKIVGASNKTKLVEIANKEKVI